MKKEQEHLKLEGEENPEQLNLEGKVFKRATSKLMIERATQLGEAIDEEVQAKALVVERTNALDCLFEKEGNREAFVDVSTMAGNQYRFYPRDKHSVVCKKLKQRAAGGDVAVFRGGA